jgi:hypothetical protein
MAGRLLKLGSRTSAEDDLKRRAVKIRYMLQPVLDLGSRL